MGKMEPRERKELWLEQAATIEELVEVTKVYSSEEAKRGDITLEDLLEIYKKSVDMAAGFERLLRDKEKEDAE